MEQIGTKHKHFFINGSRLIIITWFIYSLITSLIINQELVIKHLINSLLFYALFFLPLYFLLINFILKNNLKRRVSISLLAIIPVIISYSILFIKMNFLLNSIIKIVFILLILFLINLILASSKKLIILIISTFINTIFANIIYFIFVIKYINYSRYELVSLYISDFHLFDTYIIIILFSQTILIMIYYLYILNKPKREDNYARNS